MSNKTTEQIDEFIKDTLQELSKKHKNFKFTVKGKSDYKEKELEKSFQRQLCEMLDERSRSDDGWKNWNWQWKPEAKFVTKGLTNSRYIEIDIIGKPNDSSGQPSAVIIELKYVTTTYNPHDNTYGAPSNALGFPYDLLKDCIKIELAITGEAETKPIIESDKPFYGVIIGLTNYNKFWINNPENNGWSKNYFKTIAKPDTNDPIIFQPSLILTTNKNGDKSLQRSIFEDKRNHLSFCYPWQLSWHDYSELDEENTSNFNIRKEYKKFMYIYCIPAINDKALYQHDISDPTYIPFLDQNTQTEFLKQQNKFKQKVKKTSRRKKAAREMAKY